METKRQRVFLKDTAAHFQFWSGLANFRSRRSTNLPVCFRLNEARTKIKQLMERVKKGKQDYETLQVIYTTRFFIQLNQSQK